MSAGSEPLQTARWIPGDLTDKNPLPARAGLVSAAYVLNEVREEDRPAVLLRLWAAAEDVLLLIEPGTPEGFRQLRAARDCLLAQGAVLLAPCRTKTVSAPLGRLVPFYLSDRPQPAAPATQRCGCSLRR